MNKEGEKTKRGRPKLQIEDYIKKDDWYKITKWKQEGQNDDWISKQIGVGKDKLIEWKKENTEFSELFKNGRDKLLYELEQTLFTRAKGYYVTETEEEINGNGELIKEKKKTKYVWSDNCLSMALKQLDKNKWNDKEIGVISKENIKEILNQLTPEELDEVLADV